MMAEHERREVAASDLIWVSPMDETGYLNGRVEIGVTPDQVVGKLLVPDGFLVTWTSAFPRDTVTKASPLVVPMALLTVPDYPCDDAVTVMWALPDARRIAREILGACNDAERVMKREQRQQDQLVKAYRAQQRVDETALLTQCAWEGCRRSRSFFDADGRGYCGKHADQLGIRSTGKIT